MTYCMIPDGIGSRNFRALERYAVETGVALVRERRTGERRASDDRRVRKQIGRFRSAERRTILNSAGRRVADRRAATVPVTPPLPLPRRLRTANVGFVAPLEVSPEHVEDVLTARLVIRIQAGESDLFHLLYEQWFDRIYTYARAVLERSSHAEFAAQGVFADLYAALSGYQVDSERFRTWLGSMMASRIREELVALSGADVVSADEPEPHATAPAPHAVPSWVTDADLQVLVSRLPLPERNVLMLRYLMGLSQVEVGTVVDRSAGDVSGLHASGLGILAARQLAIGKPSEASSIRFAMVQRRRSARVLQSRRLALTPG
jgi:RNA polymerase sigma factor (sigma-70 family)